MNSGTLGGKFTTIEGLLKDICEQLCGSNPFFSGDSSQSDYKEKMNDFMNQLNDIQTGKLLNVTIVLDDPAGNSYLQVW
jgi:zinc finger protein